MPRHVSSLGATDVRGREEKATTATRGARHHLMDEPLVRLGRSNLSVFMCHGSEDKSRVRALRETLLEHGFDAWLDEAEILPGQDWDAEIRRAVRGSDTVLVCLSKTSIGKSGYLQKEIRFALDVADEKPDGMIFLIPARLEPCEVPDRLQR